MAATRNACQSMALTDRTAHRSVNDISVDGQRCWLIKLGCCVSAYPPCRRSHVRCVRCVAVLVCARTLTSFVSGFSHSRQQVSPCTAHTPCVCHPLQACMDRCHRNHEAMRKRRRLRRCLCRKKTSLPVQIFSNLDSILTRVFSNEIRMVRTTILQRFYGH